MSTRKQKPLLSDAELEQIARHFRLLGEPMRLKILQAVCQTPLTVTEIVAATGATQANVSKHLALLAAAGILQRQRDGQRVFYGVQERLVIELCELVRAQLAE